MAPEIAFEALSSLPRGSLVLDPMCGSGTVLEQALRHGHRAIGVDTDPLAVLISRVSSHDVEPNRLRNVANGLADQAVSMQDESLTLPWIDNDSETRAFTEFWFGAEQRRSLRPLAHLIARRRGVLGHALRLAISRIIITKAPHASLARDTSHSRPHRVAEFSNYDVMQGFRRAAAQIAQGLERNPLRSSASVRRGDARRLPASLTGQVDIVVSSPPYGNAIDYLRGHRLSLVWLGACAIENEIIPTLNY